MAASSSIDRKERAHFTYIWKIESALINEVVRSPVFTVQSVDITKWSLCIIIFCPSNETCFWIERAKEDDGPESIEMELELSILDTKGFLLCKGAGTIHIPKTGNSKILKFAECDELFNKIENTFFLKDTFTVRGRIWRTGVETSKSELCFASTQFDVYRPSCVWVVKEFSSLQEGEKRTHTMNSAEKGFPQLTLSLSLSEKDGKKAVFIHLIASNIIKLFGVEADIALLDDEGIDYFHQRVLTFVSVDATTAALIVFEKSGLPEFLLTDDVLLVRCEMKLTSPDPACSRIEGYKFMDYSDSELVKADKKEADSDEMNETTICPFEDIVSTFKGNGTLSDVYLRAGTKSFAVHKHILSSRSSVFRTMFTKDMKEKTNKCIDISDLDANTLGRMLSYIYENKIEELTWETAANLFEAADKYELLDLKEKCSCFLKSNLSELNVCKILVLADVYQDESLTRSVQEFILDHSEILHSDAWKAFREDHSKLALETTEQIIYNIKHSRS